MSRLKRLYKAWRGGGHASSAPPPDHGQPVRIDRAGEKLVEVLPSPSGHRRVAITRDGPGIYRLRVEAWAPDWEALGVATWVQSAHEGSFADSLEQARAFAEEILAADED